MEPQKKKSTSEFTGVKNSDDGSLDYHGSKFWARFLEANYQ
jgi:hypothetical protein